MEPTAEVSPSAAIRGRIFLPYLDGMRGFFGLYIALAHMWHRLTVVIPGFYAIPQHVIAYGNAAVSLFILMSGYVIGLPVARNGLTFRGGLKTFALRRSLRILPAYYAAFLLALPIGLLLTPHFQGPITAHQTIVSICLHVFMLQNLSNGLLYTIDGPMWSVAAEVDIYIIFALVLVPLTRRFGYFAMIGFAFLLGYLPAIIAALQHHPGHYPLANTCPWYIGIFALGFGAASFSINESPVAQRRLATWPWGYFAIGFAILLELNWQNRFADALLCLAAISQVTADTRARLRGGQTAFERFFAFRPFVFLGMFSYSFYLVHLPFFDLVMSLAQPGWTHLEVYALAVLALIGALAFAYGFFILIERRFMTAYRRTGDAQALRSSVVQEIIESAPTPSS